MGMLKRSFQVENDELLHRPAKRPSQKGINPHLVEAAKEVVKPAVQKAKTFRTKLFKKPWKKDFSAEEQVQDEQPCSDDGADCVTANETTSISRSPIIVVNDMAPTVPVLGVTPPSTPVLSGIVSTVSIEPHDDAGRQPVIARSPIFVVCDVAPTVPAMAKDLSVITPPTTPVASGVVLTITINSETLTSTVHADTSKTVQPQHPVVPSQQIANLQNESNSVEIQGHNPSAQLRTPSPAPPSPSVHGSRKESVKCSFQKEPATEESPEKDKIVDYFGPIVDISDKSFVELVKRRLGMPDASPRDIYVKGEASGDFNMVKFVHCKGQDLAIKVPGAGWDKYWTEDRAEILVSEVTTLELIRTKTDAKCPVPHVLGHDDAMDNEIGAPYIIMERLPRSSALDLWYDYKQDGEYYYEPETLENEDKAALRERFLWSLAEKMSLLRSIQVPKIGMLTVDENGETTMGPYVSVNPCKGERVTYRSMFGSTYEFYMNEIERRYPRASCGAEESGIVRFLKDILDTEPFHASTQSGDYRNREPESFVLAHADFNLQNILCNPETGEVTGIIDWEGAHFLPRCVGYTSVPLFLRDDWSPHYNFIQSGVDSWRPPSVQKLDSWRKMYAKAMKFHMQGHNDSFFTLKSAMYNAFHTSLYPELNTANGHILNVIYKLIHQIVPYADAPRVMIALGDGDETLGEVVRREVMGYFMGA
jgi:hypothetical protein